MHQITNETIRSHILQSLQKSQDISAQSRAKEEVVLLISKLHAKDQFKILLTEASRTIHTNPILERKFALYSIQKVCEQLGSNIKPFVKQIMNYIVARIKDTEISDDTGFNKQMTTTVNMLAQQIYKEPKQLTDIYNSAVSNPLFQKQEFSISNSTVFGAKQEVYTNNKYLNMVISPLILFLKSEDHYSSSVACQCLNEAFFVAPPDDLDQCEQVSQIIYQEADKFKDSHVNKQLQIQLLSALSILIQKLPTKLLSTTEQLTKYLKLIEKNINSKEYQIRFNALMMLSNIAKQKVLNDNHIIKYKKLTFSMKTTDILNVVRQQAEKTYFLLNMIATELNISSQQTSRSVSRQSFSEFKKQLIEKNKLQQIQQEARQEVEQDLQQNIDLIETDQNPQQIDQFFQENNYSPINPQSQQLCSPQKDAKQLDYNFEQVQPQKQFYQPSPEPEIEKLNMNEEENEVVSQIHIDADEVKHENDKYEESVPQVQQKSQQTKTLIKKQKQQDYYIFDDVPIRNISYELRGKSSMRPEQVVKQSQMEIVQQNKYKSMKQNEQQNNQTNTKDQTNSQNKKVSQSIIGTFQSNTSQTKQFINFEKEYTKIKQQNYSYNQFQKLLLVLLANSTNSLANLDQKIRNEVIGYVLQFLQEGYLDQVINWLFVILQKQFLSLSQYQLIQQNLGQVWKSHPRWVEIQKLNNLIQEKIKLNGAQ